MSTLSKIITILSITAVLQPTSVLANPGDIFDVIDFKFSMDCTNNPEIGNPQFPDTNVKNPAVIANSQFIEGEFAGVRPGPPPGNGEQNTETYVEFEFFGSQVSNYTAARGVDHTQDPSLPDHLPPSFDRNNLTANLSSFYAYWNGTEFNQGNGNVILTDNLDRTYTTDHLALISGGTFNGCTGRWKFDLDCTNCPDSNLGISPEITSTQNNSSTRSILTTDGTVILSSSLAIETGYAFNWASSDNSITDSDGSLIDGTFEFNPNAVTPGNYTFTMTYINSNTDPVTKGRSKIILSVIDSATADMSDDNNNGIPNYLDDTSLTSSQLMTVAGNSVSHIIQTSNGHLKLGTVAFCANKAAGITLPDIENYGGLNCSTSLNSADNQIKAVGIGGYFDFEVHGLTAGERIDVILPLTEAIPTSATYRKYNTLSGWTIFDATGTDTIASSNSLDNGICPSPESDAYKSGLTAGDKCVRLSITDGGPNDADSSANGVIVDPGAISEIQSGTEAELSSGCSLSRNNRKISEHYEWLLLIAFVGFLGLKRKLIK